MVLIACVGIMTSPNLFENYLGYRKWS